MQLLSTQSCNMSETCKHLRKTSIVCAESKHDQQKVL